MAACRFGHKDVVQLFLDYSERIDLKSRSNHGWTAFMLACYNGHKDVVKIILKYSEVVDINIPESFQLSEDIRNLIESHSMRVQNWNKNLIFDTF